MRAYRHKRPRENDVGIDFMAIPKDVICLILYNLDLPTLWHICGINHKIAAICKSNEFKKGYAFANKHLICRILQTKIYARMRTTSLFIDNWFMPAIQAGVWNSQTQINTAVEWHARTGQLDNVTYLLSNYEYTGGVFALHAAVVENRLDVVKVLITMTNVRFTILNYFALRISARNGYLSMMQFFISTHKANPIMENNNVFRIAARCGHLDIVQYLIGIPGVDPTAHDNYAIRWAANYGHLNVVNFLSGIQSVDITARDNEAFRFAAKNGHLDLVKFIASLPNVAHNANNNQALKMAYQGRHKDVVSFLLTLERVNTTLSFDQIFYRRPT